MCQKIGGKVCKTKTIDRLDGVSRISIWPIIALMHKTESILASGGIISLQV